MKMRGRNCGSVNRKNSKDSAKESLTQAIYDDMLRKFMTNDLIPGTIIDRKTLAEEYQVSMAPIRDAYSEKPADSEHPDIRDALQRLTLEGFIETKSRSATVVKAIQKEDIYGTLIMREALESEAVRLICGETVRSHYEALMESARNVDATADVMEYWQADVDFHCQLVSLSNCELLIETHKKVMNVGRFYQVNSFFMNRDPQKRESHCQLVQDLITDDANLAEQLMRHHLQAGKNELREQKGHR